MAKILVFPAGYASISIGEADYRPDTDGMVHVEDESHIPDLVRFGAHDPSAVIVYADQPVEDSPEPSEAPEEVAATEVAEVEEDAPETPSESTEEAVEAVEAAPSEDDTKNDLVEWLAQRGVDVPSKATKAEVWAMIQEIMGNE